MTVCNWSVGSLDHIDVCESIKRSPFDDSQRALIIVLNRRAASGLHLHFEKTILQDFNICT